MWIAAHAKAAAVALVTNNEREFQRVPGSKTQNWVGWLSCSQKAVLNFKWHNKTVMAENRIKLKKSYSRAQILLIRNYKDLQY